MANSLSNKQIICCYCGTSPATTRDHLPPKGIFNKPLPSDLITVPACQACNNGASSLDERFKLYLGLHVARYGGEAERLFKEGTLRTARHSPRLRQSAIETAKPVYLTTQSGIITGKAISILWDSDAHDAVIERLVRGLFFLHYGKVLGEAADVSVQWFKNLVGLDFSQLYINSIANGAFVYAHNKAVDTEWDSIWLFQFYNAHWAGGHTKAKLVCP